MKNEEIKQWLESGARATGDYFFANAHNLITKQEQEIAELKAATNDWKQRYESLDQRYMALVASSVECVDKKVKKAKIDVLDKLEERIKTAIDAYWNSNSGGYYLAEDVIDDIDEMIAAVQNE